MSDVDAADARRWEAVEEATELLVDHEWERALELLRDVITKDPANAYAYHYVGTALYELGKLEPARAAFAAAVTIAPDYRGARLGLSHALRRLGRAEEAVLEAREALDRFPDDGEAIHAHGLALAARGDKAGARRELERYLRTNPDFEASVEARGMLEMLGQANEDDDDLPFELP
jgi:tetratricopeptide (TPR) repeat protein